MAENTVYIGRNRAAWSPQLANRVRVRMRGPGGFYILADLQILLTGISLQIHAAMGAGEGLASAVRAYFFGTPEATLLTFSMTFFILGGEFYHRGWTDPKLLDQRLIRLAELFCGVAATLFTAALVLIGEPVLGLLGGVGMIIARAGLVLIPGHGQGTAWHRRLRQLLVICRAPQILSVIFALSAIGIAEGAAISYAAPVSVLIGLLLSLRADLMFRPFQSRLRT